jgi:hypothetical protein
MRYKIGFSNPTGISKSDSGAIGIIKVPKSGMASKLAGRPNEVPRHSQYKTANHQRELTDMH